MSSAHGITYPSNKGGNKQNFMSFAEMADNGRKIVSLTGKCCIFTLIAYAILLFND